jgi:anti-anti-sigma factor
MLTVETVDKVTLVHFEWPALVDDADIERVGDQLLHLVETMLEPRLVLDLSNVRRVSSRLVSVIAEVHRETKAAGGGLALTGVMPDLSRVFNLTGLDRTLNIYENTSEGIESFSLESARA